LIFAFSDLVLVSIGRRGDGPFLLINGSSEVARDFGWFLLFKLEGIL